MIDEDILVDENIVTAFNLGFRYGATAEGQRKAKELIKGKENLPISKAIMAGVEQAMTDKLKEKLENNKLRKGLRP